MQEILTPNTGFKELKPGLKALGPKRWGNMASQKDIAGESKERSDLRKTRLNLAGLNSPDLPGSHDPKLDPSKNLFSNGSTASDGPESKMAKLVQDLKENDPTNSESNSSSGKSSERPGKELSSFTERVKSTLKSPSIAGIKSIFMSPEVRKNTDYLFKGAKSIFFIIALLTSLLAAAKIPTAWLKQYHVRR